MFRRDAKIELLKQVPLFAECSKRELAEVAALADEMHFPAGKTLIEEGKRGREFFVVVDGSVEVRRKGRRAGKHDGWSFYGEAALLTGKPRNATVTTTTPVRALVITDRAFDQLLRDSPSIQRKLLASLAARLAD
ncbi:MAG TPA: cyclic nucleotide-binding domain-containing protein [Gaiellaceae bacterium]|nr:cyclic nucleotide-binding domain-containing protein [Gaiellaceae bacterium]